MKDQGRGQMLRRSREGPWTEERGDSERALGWMSRGLDGSEMKGKDEWRESVVKDGGRGGCEIEAK